MRIPDGAGPRDRQCRAAAATPEQRRVVPPLNNTRGGVRADQPQALVLPEELGEVVIVRAGVARAGEREDLSPDGLGEAARGGPSAVAMGECRRAVLADLRQQTTEVTERPVEEPAPAAAPSESR